MAAPLPQDKKAGFTGLIVGVIVLFCVLYGIVLLTSHHYARLEQAKAAATR